ncbi:sodium- and chloride-dependent glycine transporter 2-like, partial [Limulus polyphemus]|uniref:Sodium- and chloride-dependent glycine transporter 2-like n=1 Tax=Limulus polyphemus TaxID=6850 RepID=A0ABM1BT15_LIMPO
LSDLYLIHFSNFVLDLTEGLHDLGAIKWQLALCLLACWVVIFFCLVRGIKSIGKVVYFTALFPYIVLVILLIRGATLNGAYDGILFYLTPEWHRLKEAKVWADAAMQIFFSLSPCWGGLITLASYNRFHNNCFRDSLIITFGNCSTSIFAGFVIFSIVGFMAHELGVPVSEVAAQEAHIGKVEEPVMAYPYRKRLYRTGLYQDKSGTQSGETELHPEQFTLIETVVTTIVDTCPHRLRRNKHYILGLCCTVMFLLGLLICTEGGMYVLQLLDNYCASFSALIIGVIEVLVIGWLYGIERFLDDVKVMLGWYPFHYQYWRIMWKFLTPFSIVAVLVFSWVDIHPTNYGSYVYPDWATAVGWALSMFSVSAIPLVACIKICKADGPIRKRIKTLLQPTEDWGPKLQMHRMETRSPKHTDSQVPLALPNYDPDCYDDNDFPDDQGDGQQEDTSDSEGLKLKIPSYPNHETGL